MLSLTLSLPSVPYIVSLVNQYKWKANGKRKKQKSVPLLAALKLKRKTQREDRRQSLPKKMSQAEKCAPLHRVPSACWLCSCFVHEFAGGTVELLHVSCSLFSSMSTRKFEDRREKGIEGMSWGSDNKVGSTAPHLWRKTFLDLSRPLVSLFSLPFPLVLRVSVSNYLFLPSLSVVTRSQMKNG